MTSDPASPRLVQHFLEQNAHRPPTKVALVCDDRRWTYEELDGMARRLANWLRKQGVADGDRIAIYLGNCVETVVSLFAVLKAGGVFVVINPGTKPAKLTYILRDCGAIGLITTQSALAQKETASAIAGVPSLKFVVACGSDAAKLGTDQPKATAYCSIQSTEDSALLPCASIEVDLACLIYTSGTTGEPKGVMCAHENIVFATHAIVSYLANSESDVVLSVLPLSFTYGLYQVFATFFMGATLLLENSFAYPSLILQRMQEERVTGFPGVPIMYAVLLRLDLAKFNLRSLRFLTNAAAPLAPDAVVEITRRFPQARFYSMYGQTETARALYLPPEWIERKPASVGMAIPGTNVWLEDELGQRVGPGITGELIVRGRHVMRGYWSMSNATAARFGPGPLMSERVYRTGDLFRTDEDGFFYFVSRQDDIIKCRGEKVAPREVENVLFQIKGVSQAAVVGMSDPLWGQAVKAFLVAEEPAPTVLQVQAHCRRHLEDHMVPRVVEFLKELPMTPNGKIKRSELL